MVKLPTSGGFDSVMVVVVYHFLQKAHFIPAKKSWSVNKLAEMFITNVFKLHDLPDKIVSY